MKITFVGQAPGRKPGPVLGGQSGKRLAKLMGISPAEFRRRFRRVNLLPMFPGRAAKGDAFPMWKARIAARRTKLRGRTVLVGRSVASAFGLRRIPFLVWFRLGAATVAVIPHPSGVCRWWNDPRNISRAKEFLRPLAR